MINIVGVRFKKPGKIYFFNPKNLNINKNEYVIVDTSQGEEYGEVVIANREVSDDTITTPLREVIRIANKKDKKIQEENKEKEKEAFAICEEKIKKHKLNMKLVDAEYKFDRSKLLFYS